MKKIIKVVIPAAVGVISIAVWIFTIIMINTVNSEKIFFLDSELGSFYASAYRIFAVISAVLLIIWILAAVRNVPRLIALIKTKLKREKITEEQQNDAAEKSDSAESKDESLIDVPATVPLVETNDTAAKPITPLPEADKVIEEIIDPFEPTDAPSESPALESVLTSILTPASATDPNPASTPANGTGNCTKCGKLIPIQAKFCPFCGNKNL